MYSPNYSKDVIAMICRCLVDDLPMFGGLSKTLLPSSLLVCENMISYVDPY